MIFPLSVSLSRHIFKLFDAIADCMRIQSLWNCLSNSVYTRQTVFTFDTLNRTTNRVIYFCSIRFHFREKELFFGCYTGMEIKCRLIHDYFYVCVYKTNVGFTMNLRKEMYANRTIICRYSRHDTHYDAIMIGNVWFDMQRIFLFLFCAIIMLLMLSTLCYSFNFHHW